MGGNTNTFESQKSKAKSKYSEKKDKVAGRTKQAAGVLIDDKDLERKGKRQENKGKVKGVVNKGLDKAEDIVDDIRERVRS